MQSTILKACTTSSWHLNSGWSRHMTGYKEFLKNYQQCDLGHVTYRDGIKGCILGKGTIDVEGTPKLKNVLPCGRTRSNSD